MWKPKLFALRAIGGCKSNRSTVRHSYMFTAHLYLTKSTSAGDIRAQLDVRLLTQMVYLCPCLHLYCLKRLGLNYCLRQCQYSSVIMTALAWIHIHTRVPWAEVIMITGPLTLYSEPVDKHARNQAPKLVWSLFLVCSGQPDRSDVNWWDHFTQIKSWRYELYSNWTNVCDGNIHQAVYQGFMTVGWSFFAKFKVTDVGVTRFSPHGQFLYVGRIKLRNLPISASSWQSFVQCSI